MDYSNVHKAKLQGWIPPKWWTKKEEKIIQYIHEQRNSQIKLYQMDVDDAAFRLQATAI